MTMPDILELPGASIRLCRVPAGKFIRGGESSPDERPVESVYLDEYLIGWSPVTNAQYECFLRDTGHRAPPLRTDEVFGAADHPVVGVSWYDAVSFCTWAAEVSGLPVCLPTEAQWERASRGDDGRTYPWGDAPPKPELLNASDTCGATTPVGAYGAGDSPFGLTDCMGNVWEWCTDWYADYDDSTINPSGPDSGSMRTTRGGSWRSDAFRATCHHRCMMNPSVRSDRHGFRIAVQPSPEDPR